MRDAMTGLFNRFGYKRLGYAYFDEKRAACRDSVILFGGINYMKGINDTYGRLHGDLATKSVGKVLQHVFPEEWLGIRYGGDEYLLIGADATKEQVLQYCKDTEAYLKERVKKMALPYQLSISTGYQIVGADRDISLDVAVKMADEMMYRHKEDFHSRESGIS